MRSKPFGKMGMIMGFLHGIICAQCVPARFAEIKIKQNISFF
jgi:hypothetical protein